MSENRAAYLANSSEVYDRRRFEETGGVELDPLPTAEFRFNMTLRCLEWCMTGQPLENRAVLDVSAGLGNVGQWLREKKIPTAYHATEQSPKQCEAIKERVPGASVAEWRCGSFLAETHPTSTLKHALEHASDTFLREYPAALLSHGPEHHEDAYAIVDECWSMVKPGGFLLIVSARNDPHRSHYRKYDWDDLLALGAHYAGFGNPLVVWELDAWTDQYLAIPKPPKVAA